MTKRGKITQRALMLNRFPSACAIKFGDNYAIMAGADELGRARSAHGAWCAAWRNHVARMKEKAKQG